MLNKLRDELRDIITSDSVFVCVGTHKILFDAFAPCCGYFLEGKNIPVYGTTDKNVNASNIYDRLYEIYDIDKIDAKNIIAIDSAVASDVNKKNSIEVRKNCPIRPGAGVGKELPSIGAHSIVLYTLTKDEVDYVMDGYRSGVGSKNDPCTSDYVIANSLLLANVIEEIYNEA